MATTETTDYLIFDMPYKEAYTTKIEFETQINEKQKGREQRYPKWTYPKRTFTLKFDKNFKVEILSSNPSGLARLTADYILL